MEDALQGRDRNGGVGRAARAEAQGAMTDPMRAAAAGEAAARSSGAD